MPTLQHIRSDQPDKRPDPALLSPGQLAQNRAVTSPGLFFTDAAGGLVKAGPVHIGAVAPNATPTGAPGNSTGEVWLDTSLARPVLRIWNGTEWVPVSSPGGGCEVGETAPTAPEPGDLWFRTDICQLFVWYDDGDTQQWVQANSGGGGGGLQLSTDPDNTTILGSDGGIYTPPFVETELGELVVLVTQDMNLYVATTGSDETGDGTQALPWATPHRAMAFLSKCVLADGVIATVHVADGLYEFTVPLNLNHPQGTQIFINGTSTTGTRPTGNALNGNAEQGNTAATESFNNAKLQAYYNTRWQFNGCSGITVELGGAVTVNKVLIRGNATANTFGVLAGNRSADLAASVGSVNVGPLVAVHNFGNHGVNTSLGGSICCSEVTITNCGGYGVTTTRGGSINANNCTSNNNTSDGVVVNSAGNISIGAAQVRYNGGRGLLTNGGGIISANSANVSNNAGAGVQTRVSGSIGITNSSVNFNGGQGINTLYGGAIDATGTQSVNNLGSQNVRAQVDGTIIFVGGSANNSLSPAANTIGNGKGYIAV
jgi:hypothetical protein